MNRPPPIRGWIWLLALAGAGAASADEPAFDSGILQYDWLQSADQQQAQSVNGTFSTSSSHNLSDPFAVVASGTLWQDQESVSYSRPIANGVALNCSSSTTTQDGTPGAQGSSVSAQTVFKPSDALTVTGNVHDSSNDETPGSPETTGAGASVETHLPLDTVFTAAVNSDRAISDNDPGLDVGTTNAYDAQLQKPLGKLPVSLLLKGHYVETAAPGAGATRLPSFEQSLVWKPITDTTLQAGLRQEQYQNFPGITNELNDALFADWSQKIVGDLSWHSYAEMINSRSTIEEAAPVIGSSGSSELATSGGSSLSSSLPVSTTDETVTFSTGPSIKLQQDLSASLQYSSSWDQSSAPGASSDEQRVSVSLKGTF